MIFRIKALVPLLILAALLWFFGEKVSTPVIKGKLEDSLPGLDIRQLNVDLESQTLSLDGSATYSDNLGTLASLAKFEMKLERAPLGFGELAASGNVEDIRLSKRLFVTTPSSTSQGPSGNASPSAPDSPFGLDSLDHREVLERFTGQRQLETEKRIEEGRFLLEELEKKWVPRRDALKGELTSFRQNRTAWSQKWSSQLGIESLVSKAKALKNEAETLKDLKFDTKDLGQLTTNLQKIQDFQTRLKGLQTTFEATRQQAKGQIDQLGPLGQALGDPSHLGQEIESDLQRVIQLKKDLKDSTKRDTDLLKKELDPRSFNSSKTVRLIMGREWELKFKSALDILDNSLGPLLPKDIGSSSGNGIGAGTTPPDVTSSPSGPPESVDFFRPNQRPAWTLSSLRYAGYATQAFENADVRFEGSLNHLSSDEALLGHSPRMSFIAFLPGRGGELKADLRYSLTSNTPDQRVLKIELRDRPLVGTTMGAPSSRLHFKGGHWGLDGVVDLSSAPNWKVDGKFLWQEASFDLGPGVKEDIREPLRSAATRLLSNPVAFSYRYPDEMKFTGDFENWLGPIFNDALVAVATREQGRLTSKLQSRLNPKTETLFKDSQLEGLLGKSLPLLIQGSLGEKQAFSELQKLAGAHLEKLGNEENLLAQLLSDVIGLKGKGEGAKGDLEATLKEEAQRRLQELATQKLQEKLLGGKASTENPDAPKEGEAPKDPKEEIKEHLKDELKKELKDAFKGFSF